MTLGLKTRWKLGQVSVAFNISRHFPSKLYPSSSCFWNHYYWKQGGPFRGSWGQGKAIKQNGTYWLSTFQRWKNCAESICAGSTNLVNSTGNRTWSFWCTPLYLPTHIWAPHCNPLSAGTVFKSWQKSPFKKIQKLLINISWQLQPRGKYVSVSVVPRKKKTSNTESPMLVVWLTYPRYDTVTAFGKIETKR